MHILKNNNSAIISALTSVSPIFVLIISLLLLKEKIHPIAVAGVFVTVFGVALISYGDHIISENYYSIE